MTDDNVLRGMDAARRAGWAKYYEASGQVRLARCQIDDLAEALAAAHGFIAAAMPGAMSVIHKDLELRGLSGVTAFLRADHIERGKWVAGGALDNEVDGEWRGDAAAISGS